MAYAILRIEKMKSCSALAKAERHGKNREHLKHLSYPERTKENKIFKKYKDLTLVQSWKKDTEGMKVRKNAVYALEIVLTFSPEVRREMEMQADEWVQTNMNWIAKEFGKENILQARCEFDESNLHQHIFVVPIKDGRLCCREFVGGKAKMINLQTSYAEAVGKFGLERGRCILDSPNEPPRHHTSLSDYYRKMEQERGTNAVVVDIQRKVKLPKECR